LLPLGTACSPRLNRPAPGFNAIFPGVPLTFPQGHDAGSMRPNAAGCGPRHQHTTYPGKKRARHPHCCGYRANTWRRPTLTGPVVPIPSALQRFTSGFGMGPGGSTALWPPEGGPGRRFLDSGPGLWLSETPWHQRMLCSVTVRGTGCSQPDPCPLPDIHTENTIFSSTSIRPLNRTRSLENKRLRTESSRTDD